MSQLRQTATAMCQHRWTSSRSSTRQCAWLHILASLSAARPCAPPKRRSHPCCTKTWVRAAATVLGLSVRLPLAASKLPTRTLFPRPTNSEASCPFSPIHHRTTTRASSPLLRREWQPRVGQAMRQIADKNRPPPCRTST